MQIATRRARRPGMGAGMLLVALLSGCSGGASTGTGPSVSEKLGNILAFNSTVAPPAPGARKEEIQLDCPQVEVQDGTASLRVGGQTNTDVRYQYSLGEVERECVLQGDRIAIKVGIQGRVLVGPQGGAGSFTAPVRVAIRRESDLKPEVSKLYQVPVTVPAGSDQAPFSLVTEPLFVPFIKAQADADYAIVVGFDEKGAPAAKPALKHKRKG